MSLISLSNNLYIEDLTILSPQKAPPLLPSAVIPIWQSHSRHAGENRKNSLQNRSHRELTEPINFLLAQFYSYSFGFY